MTWMKISFLLERIPFDRESLENRLTELGVSGIVEDDHQVHVWVDESAVKEFLSGLDSVPEDAVQIRPEEDRDWETWWRRDLGVVRVGRFVIVPSWEEYSPEPDDLVLHIDPGMAFGTAHHPTTRLCLRALEWLEHPPRTILDMGTGSGILAIAAGLLFPGARITAWDTDPLALEETERNARAHGVEVALQNPDESTKFDLVLANISPPVLKDMARSLKGWVAPGGVLVLSGIPGPEAEAVKSAYDLPLIREENEDGWRLLMYGR